MMLTNDTWIGRQESYFKKLTKSHEDLLKIDCYYKKKNIESLKMNIFNFIVERFFKLSLLLLTITTTIFFYYFYIYVNKII